MSDVEIGSEWVEKNDKNRLVILRESKKDNFQIKTGEEGECYISRANLLAHYNLKADMVNHPPHYKDASGIECIEVTKHMSFCGGNCFKYLYRAGKKGSTVEDLKKAKWYAERACELGENLNQEAREKIREVRRYRELGICNAMRAICFSNWMLVIEWIDLEIARLESER